MPISVATSLDYLISDLRLQVGDLDSTSYTDGFLRQVLVMATKTLMKKWRNRYTINSGYTVARNSSSIYSQDSPPVIEYADERAFILQASIIIKSSDITDKAWDVGSWRDDELAYSNIAGASALLKSLRDDIDELAELLKRRLFSGSKQSLGGFRLPFNIAEGSK